MGNLNFFRRWKRLFLWRASYSRGIRVSRSYCNNVRQEDVSFYSENISLNCVVNSEAGVPPRFHMGSLGIRRSICERSLIFRFSRRVITIHETRHLFRQREMSGYYKASLFVFFLVSNTLVMLSCRIYNKNLHLLCKSVFLNSTTRHRYRAPIKILNKEKTRERRRERGEGGNTPSDKLNLLIKSTLLN